MQLNYIADQLYRRLDLSESQVVVSRLVAVLVLSLVSVSASLVFAQQFHVQTYSEEEGLPSTNVHGMVKSADGQVWFATRNGIATYDGQTWRNYGLKDGLATVNQQRLAIDSKQRIWAVSSGSVKSISVFENARWQTWPLRLTTAAFSILTIDGESPRALIGHHLGLLLVEDGKKRQLEFESKQTVSVFGLQRLNGKIYAATSIGLFTVDLDSKPELKQVNGVPQTPIKSLTHDPLNNRLWLVGDSSISTFDGQKWSQVEQTFDDPVAKMDDSFASIVSLDGGLYFGTRTGMFSYRPDEGIKRIGMENGLASEGVNDFLLDRDGLLWISSERGVSKIASFRFANYGRRDGLFDHEVSAILLRSDGTKVLGHDGGLTFFDEKPGKTLELGPHGAARVHDIVEDANNHLWIAAYESGLFQIDEKGKTTHFPGMAEWRGRVNSVCVDDKNQLWVATDGGIFRREGNQFVADPLPKRGFGSRKLFTDSQGRVLAATVRQGLWRRDIDQWKNWSGASLSPTSNVFAFLDRENERPWIGTMAGLCTLAGDEIVKLEQPRIDRPVYFIVEDQQQQIWLGTDNGVMRWDGKDLRHFSVKHGLIGRETNRAAGKVDEKGRVWIGTVKGLSIYRPELDFGISQPPNVKLISVESGDQNWDPMTAHRMPHSRNSLTFDYRAISFLDENEIRVRSWLEGLESGWQDEVRPREWKIRYGFLPPGRYRLHLQAANLDGVWSEVVTSNFIRIHPPFWNTGWFYALAIFGVASIGFFSHRLFSRRKYTRRLEREVVARLAELQESEKRYGVTLNSIADGVMTTEMNGKVLFMNPAAEQILGRTLEDAQGQTLMDILPLHDSFGAELNELIDHLVKGSHWTSTLQFKTTGGSARTIEAGTAPLRNAEQKLLGAVVAIRDVTEKIRLQKELAQSQKLASLGTLAGGIAHDFNNLLAVVSWNMTALKDPSQSARQNAIDLVASAVSQARNLTQQIITFARGGSPRLQTQFLNELIEESISFLANEPDFQFELELAEDLCPIDIDAVQINQVFNNILMNAKQAMPKGGVIQIHSNNFLDRSFELESRFVEIVIRDQGEGIPADQIDRVFEPYFTTKDNGSGIGLATSFSIIQRHDGQITVESEVGHGTTFRILLPASRQIPKTINSRHETQTSDSKRLLVVDDDELVRQSMRAILKSIGFSVLDVASGNEAISVYERERQNGRNFHAVLIDLTMRNGIGGVETLKRLRKIDPSVRGIVVSGYSDEQVLSDFESYGFVDRLEKPCTLEELQAALDFATTISGKSD